MKTYNLGLIISYIVSFLIIFLVVYLITRWAKKGEKRCKYDERQQILRGNGYKYGFYAMIISLVLFMIAEQLELAFPFETDVIYFFIIVIGVIVDIVYCIWNDSYFSLNEQKTRILVIFFVIGAFNLAVGIMHIIDGTSITDGKLNSSCINLICGFLFVIIFGAQIARKLFPEKDASDDE